MPATVRVTVAEDGSRRHDPMTVAITVANNSSRLVMRTVSLDRYAARNVNSVFVASDRIAVLAARSAARETGNQSRGSVGISRERSSVAG
jgi:hypothetical protein